MLRHCCVGAHGQSVMNCSSVAMIRLSAYLLVRIAAVKCVVTLSQQLHLLASGSNFDRAHACSQ